MIVDRSGRGRVTPEFNDCSRTLWPTKSQKPYQGKSLVLQNVAPRFVDLIFVSAGQYYIMYNYCCLVCGTTTNGIIDDTHGTKMLLDWCVAYETTFDSSNLYPTTLYDYLPVSLVASLHCENTCPQATLGFYVLPTPLFAGVYSPLLSGILS